MTIKHRNFITIGTFDGLHIGHQVLVESIKRLGKKYDLNPLVLYFPFPPKTMLSSHPEMTVLTLPKEKAKLFKMMKLSANALNFDECRNMQPKDFVENILIKKYKMGGLVVGPDFAFGKDRNGSVEFLRETCQKIGNPFEVIPFYSYNNTKISSSLIRKLIAQGNISESTQFLTRPYTLSGTIIKGKQLGRKLGFPTANLDTGIYKILPLGVFAVKVFLGKEAFDGFCNIGFRPTVNTINDKLPLVEVHIFNFKRSIYGRKLTIQFIEKIRDEIKFNGLDALVNQIRKDKQTATIMLNKNNQL